MTGWNLAIPEETDRIVRAHIAHSGGTQGDLARFVDQAVRKEVLRETIREIQDRNSRFDQNEIMNTVDEAVDWARADRS